LIFSTLSKKNMVISKLFCYFLAISLTACGNAPAKKGSDKQPKIEAEASSKTDSISPDTLKNTTVESAKTGKSGEENGEKIANDTNFSYDFANPVQTLELPESLVEISGISLYKGKKLVGVQDEAGIIYSIDRETGAVSDSFLFTPTGDFEGITFVGNTAWVLEANGKLWAISDWDDAEKRQIKTYKTSLKKDNDAEGLCFDSKNNRLLIACKESPLIDEYRKDMRAVYAFDLQTMELDETPFLTFDIAQILAHFEAVPTSNIAEKQLKKLEKGKILPIMPSEIAIHPVSGELYILASDGLAMLVFSPDGKQILHIQALDSDIFEQPEGLAFLPNGDLYISSEGREDVAKIRLFKAIKN
jgi:uncharacterized protein YjiK